MEILRQLKIKPPAGATYQEKLSLHLHHKLKTKLDSNTKMFDELAEYADFFNKLEIEQKLGLRKKALNLAKRQQTRAENEFDLTMDDIRHGTKRNMMRQLRAP